MRTRSAITATATAIAAASGYAVLHRLGRTAGSTRSERRHPLPGDELVRRPQFVTDHATTIDAPAAAVWPWLVQMGWHRGGWYTSRWVDALLFPDNRPAADRIHPEWQSLAVGDHVLDGAPETECSFVVDQLDPGHHLVLLSRSHLPPAVRDRIGAQIEWSWVFALTDLDDGRCRFHFRTRARLAPGWLALAYWLVLIPADLVMGRQLLAGVRRRAESIAPGRSSPPRPPPDHGNPNRTRGRCRNRSRRSTAIRGPVV